MADMGNFDASTVDPKKALDPIPVGVYDFVITESEEKKNAKETGTYHQFTLQVYSGEYKGRKVWVRLNLNNPNDQAVAIARAELSAMCRAIGKLKVRDSTELHDLPFKAKVVMDQNKKTGEMTNKIKEFIPQGENAKSTQTAATPVRAPWQRK